ncbi:hypothetical protein [Gelidibacter pelagius]|uniref:Uncharacterized protein n=1 Tax=Gelidibacter pelagius TaxID=2819985 RepID=A0ABS3SM91_9FLAO|nr:hypothetical protein [Gelidibacter pelagius]MBO3096828.1 hypothetical protein [Gelidibacter pelagius]
MNEDHYLNSLQENNQSFIDQLIEDDFHLPQEPPVEIHPYLSEIKLKDYDKYIVGTFPPISYLNDNQILVNNGLDILFNANEGIITKPAIPFFHGNSPQASMWNLLLDNVFENPNRQDAKHSLIDFLQNNEINYSDIIYSTKRMDYGHEDSYLRNIQIYKGLLKQIINNINLNRILFNTSSTFSVRGLSTHANNGANALVGRINVNSHANAFDLFVRGLQDLGCSIQFFLEDNNGRIRLNWAEANIDNRIIVRNILKTKIIFQARVIIPPNHGLFENDRVIEKIFHVVTPFSMAARGRVELNPIINNWREENNNLERNVLLRHIYQAFVRFNDVDVNFLNGLNAF